MLVKFRLTLLILSASLAPAYAATPLETQVLSAVKAAHFEEVIDFGAGNESHPVRANLNLPAKKIAHAPNIDLAVIQLDPDGKLIDRAFVLLSRDYPQGLVVPLDQNLDSKSVRFIRWDIQRSDGGTFSSEDGHQLTTKGWTTEPPLAASDDLVPGLDSAPYQFMAPYPASLFKLMVAFHVMRMVDSGKIELETEYTYSTRSTKDETRKLRDWIDPMITVSDNHATRALLKMLHEKQEIESLNREFRELNLGTLQINGTNPKDGGGWMPGQIHMTAFDVARLLWLIDGGPGTLWVAADGKAVTSQYLSDSSRAYLKKELLDQGWNEALCTSNMPGAPHVQAGIPSKVFARWIDAKTGHVVVDGSDYGVDIRTANASAEVEFAHKTGLTFNYAADAGIVTSLPGKPFRHYVIAFIANLGSRYTDEVFADRETFPANDLVGPISYTQRIPALGKVIDQALVRLSVRAIPLQSR